MSCNRIVVSTSRCGRDNPGSNPGYSICFILNLFKICSADKWIQTYLLCNQNIIVQNLFHNVEVTTNAY